MPTSLRQSAAHQTLAKSLLWGLAAMGIVSLAGPLLSYLIDEHDAENALRGRALQAVHLYAEALELRLLAMEEDLEELAEHPRGPPPALVRASRATTTRNNSTFFGGGVALLDLKGRVTSSQPKGKFPPSVDYSSRPWFQRALRLERSVAESWEDETDSWILLVPLKNEGNLVGFVAGILRPTDFALSLSLEPHQNLALVDGDDVLLSIPVNVRPEAEQLLQKSPMGENEIRFFANGKNLVAFSSVVRGSLRLWLFSDLDAFERPIRKRLLWQLLFLSLVQICTWTVFSLFVRKSYLGFRDLEERLVEEEKMSRLGAASSLIAHEIRNTLNSLIAAIGLPQESSDESLKQRILRSQTARLSHLARSLLSLGRPVRPQKMSVAFDVAAREPLEALKILPEFSNVELSVETLPAILIDADPALVATAIDNVVRNAIEAAVAQRDMGKSERAEVHVRSHVTDDFVCLSVEDNGGGMEPRVKEQLFQPFMTSKPKGVGLGLTTTKQAMEAMGGSIRHEPLASGTRFELFFPIAREATL